MREAAEYPNSFIPLGPGEERVETERFTLCMAAGNLANTVQRQRFGADEVDDVIEEVRELLRARGRPRTQWEIGSAAQPERLGELLLYRGLIRDSEPYATALALTVEPPPGPEALDARRVATLEEFIAANEVQFLAFGTPAAEIEQQRALLVEAWERGPRLMHGIWLGQTMIGTGTCAPTPHGLALFGGATLPEARGQGAYRTLIRARWEEAREQRLGALLTQAGAMSRPILEKLGFEAVGRVEMLLDEFDRDYRSAVAGQAEAGPGPGLPVSLEQENGTEHQ